ncbi:Metallo-dependent phosphatase-like protein [Pterulicium gracile]|uniref:Metallo-dependent phosphatase-like protein n=1 Tax=Pterulicium gracile TaxID=1884261 RepID=A0A5C3Q737_9AGAR|nr:Metallo-dependent phosphatase-like protein [Pterula gracilis]
MGEDKPLNPYPDHPVLTFKDSGGKQTFNTAVFSDLHFGENPWEHWGPEHDASSMGLIEEVVSGGFAVDYVAINGDFITGESKYLLILQPIIDSKLPFLSTGGNHDNSLYITHKSEIEREQSLPPTQSYTRIAGEDIGGAGGPGNYWVPVYKSGFNSSPALVLWFFDSRGQNMPPGTEGNPDIKDWVDESVVKWIESETKKMDEQWGGAEEQGRQALAFTHIPPHHIQAVSENLDSSKNPGQHADVLGAGAAQDGEQKTRNQPFWDSLNTNVKNLCAVISGHDHGNEWCAREPTQDVIFCFDKHSGYGGYTRDSWGHGVRQVLFTMEGNNVDVESWIWVQGGEERARVKLNVNYGK